MGALAIEPMAIARPMNGFHPLFCAGRVWDNDRIRKTIFSNHY